MTSTFVLNSYNFYVEPICDPYYGSVLFHYSFDGDLVDTGPDNLTAVALGSYLDPLGAKFGTEGLYNATVTGTAAKNIGAETPVEVSVPADTEFTFELWAKWDGTTTDTVMAMSGTGTIGGNVAHAVMYMTASTGTPGFGIYNGSSYVGASGTPGAMNDNDWHHLVAMRRLEYGVWITRFYVDGVEGGTPLDEGATGQEIGGGGERWKFLSGTEGATNSGWRGAVDEVRLTRAARYDVTAETFTAPTSAHPTDVGGDPLFNSVSLLASFDGTDGATAFTSEDNDAQTATFSSSAQLDTAVKKYGTAALLVTGSTDLVEFPDSTGYAFGTGDFTVECWCYPTANPSDSTLVASLGDTGEYGWALRTGNDGDEYTQFLWSTDGQPANVFAVTSRYVPPLNEWTHIAVSRQGDIIALFANGVPIANRHMGSTNTINDAAWPLTIGNRTQSWWGRLFPFAGSIDDVRITKGTGRYTYSAQFSPPTEELPPNPCANIFVRSVGTAFSPADNLAGYGDTPIDAGFWKTGDLLIAFMGGKDRTGTGTVAGWNDLISDNSMNAVWRIATSDGNFASDALYVPGSGGGNSARCYCQVIAVADANGGTLGLINSAHLREITHNPATGGPYMPMPSLPVGSNPNDTFVVGMWQDDGGSVRPDTNPWAYPSPGVVQTFGDDPDELTVIGREYGIPGTNLPRNAGEYGYPWGPDLIYYYDWYGWGYESQNVSTAMTGGGEIVVHPGGPGFNLGSMTYSTAYFRFGIV